MGNLFVTGDVHGDPISRLSSRNFSAGKDLAIDDVVLIAGDFGVFFEDNEEARNIRSRVINWIAEKPFTVMFIGGNHENWDILNSFPVRNDLEWGPVCQCGENLFFVPNGTILNIAGKKIFCFGGAMSTDKDWRIVHEQKTGEKIWWENEVPSYEQMDAATRLLDDVDWKVDLVITHTMPSECIEDYAFKERESLQRTTDPTSRFLDFIQEGLTYDKWYCGHFHVNNTYINKSATKKVQVLYDYIVNPDDEPLRNYGRVYINPLW